MASIGQIIFGSAFGLLMYCVLVCFQVSQGTVESRSPSTVGNLAEDVVLDCRFFSNSGKEQFSDVSVTWLKDSVSGVVYEYKNKAAQLQGQNARFKNRAQLFSDAMSVGNASLLLRNVKLEDEGVYRCSVNAPKVSGTTSVNLRVAAFSAPTFTQQKDGSLFAQADKWFPQPEVSWLSQSGQLLNSSTQFINNTAGIVRVASVLKDPVKEDDTYTCLIQNSLVKAISEATITGKIVMLTEKNSNNELQMQHTVKTPCFCYKVNAAFLYDYPQQTA
uniref:V-set domain containing T cell activation inhibitor 1 n=1 Tax=Cyprinus carpio TaxID=7962 RepID=A0A8C1KXJ0_CYPCA